MRRIAANYVFPVIAPPIRNGILELDDTGKILRVIDPGEEFRETRKLEFYNGILVPGFIKAHGHLEPACPKGRLSPDRGLSILEEMKVLSDRHPEVPFGKLLEWAALYGARAIFPDSRLGRFEPGARPGVNLIRPFDFTRMRLTSDSRVFPLA